MLRSIVALSILIAPLTALAQPLADRVPAGAMVYLGWSGTASLGPGYNGSRLKAVMDSSDLPRLMDQLVPGLVRLAQREDPQAGQIVQDAGAIADILIRRPTAFFFAGVDLPENAPPQPKAALICQAGEDAPALLQKFIGLAAQARRETPLAFAAFQAKDLVVLAIGYADQNQFAAAMGDALAAAGPFKEAMAQVQKQPVAACYIDAEAVMALVTKGIDMSGDREAQRTWPIIRDAMGLGGLKRIVWAGAFLDRDWVSEAYIAAPAPRKGLLTLLDAQPISQQMIASIPATANWMAIGQIDLSKMLETVRQVAGQVDPNAPRELDNGLQMLQQQFGINLQKDVLSALGPEWAIYTDPRSTGGGLLGWIAINRLRKPAEFEQTMLKIEQLISQFANEELRRDQMRLRFVQRKVGNLTIHYAALPAVAPSWTIKDGVFYLGLYPQMVAAAAQSAGGKSIADNPSFAALRDRLNVKNPTSLVYMDLPATAGDSYPVLLYLSQFGLGFADMFGIDMPAFVIPPLPAIRDQLTPAAGAAWVDEAGWHARQITPFPGAEMYASQAGLLFAAAPMAVGVAMPAMFTARSRAMDMQGMNSLRQIAMGVIMHAQDNNGRLPADLGTLVKSGMLPAQVFVAPGKMVPGFPNRDDSAAWVNQNSDYEYIGGTLPPMPQIRNAAQTIIAYEKSGRGPLISVAFLDGHVERMPATVLEQRIAEQKRR